jgi:hypothetical protein
MHIRVLAFLYTLITTCDRRAQCISNILALDRSTVYHPSDVTHRDTYQTL